MCRAVWTNLSKQNTVDTLRDVKGRKAERWIACAGGFIRRIFSQNHALLCTPIGVSERTRNQTGPGRIPPRVELRNRLSSRVFRAWWRSLRGVKHLPEPQGVLVHVDVVKHDVDGLRLEASHNGGEFAQVVLGILVAVVNLALAHPVESKVL